jgi:signal transduction histidine kinase
MKLLRPVVFTTIVERTTTFFTADAPTRTALRRNSAAFPGWVALGLVAVSVGISALEIFTIWSEHWPHHLDDHLRPPPAAIPFPLPGIGAIVLYVILALIQPRLCPWPRWRVPYMTTIFVATLILGLFGTDPLRLLGYIAVYGVATHARVAFGRGGGWLVGSLIVLAFLLAMLLGWLGIGAKPAATVLQFSIWLGGLLFVYAFTELGTQERSARQHGEKLVAELTLMQEQLRAYAVRAEELATMRERTRVAREIHDTLAQGLTAIVMHLETGCAVFNEKPALARQHMERARNLAGEHLQGARNSILKLRTDVLDNQPLPSALAALTEAWRPWEGAVDDQATFRANDIPADTQFLPAVELACYRIAQEALGNAARHGHARRVDVELSMEADGLCLTITDDGIGFDPTTIYPHDGEGGFGIIGMRERARLLNGRLEVISAPGAGTQVFAIIPLGGIDNNPAGRPQAGRPQGSPLLYDEAAHQARV